MSRDGISCCSSLSSALRSETKSLLDRIGILSTLVACISVTIAVLVISLRSRGSPLLSNQRDVNIHLVLSRRGEMEAIRLNSLLREQLGDEQALNLASVEQPHITLYLTTFYSNQISTLLERVQNVVLSLPSDCNVTLENSLSPSGSYAMWNVYLSSCLQQMSDRIVEATYNLTVPNQAVPDWVFSISNPIIREKKIEYVRRYGSPNVFDQFAPHVTIAYSDNVNALAQSVSSIQSFVRGLSFPALHISLGNVGPYGTVLRDGNIGGYCIPCSKSDI